MRPPTELAIIDRSSAFHLRGALRAIKVLARRSRSLPIAENSFAKKGSRHSPRALRSLRCSGRGQGPAGYCSLFSQMLRVYSLPVASTSSPMMPLFGTRLVSSSIRIEMTRPFSRCVRPRAKASTFSKPGTR